MTKEIREFTNNDKQECLDNAMKVCLSTIHNIYDDSYDSDFVTSQELHKIKLALHCIKSIDEIKAHH